MAFASHPEAPDKTNNVRLVETVSLKYSPCTITVKGQGFITPSRSLVIAGQAGGRVIESCHNLKSGTVVEKGTLLVRLDDEILQNSLSLNRVILIRCTAQLCSALKSEQGALYEKWSAYLKRLNTGLTPPLPPLDSEREKLLTSTYGVLEAYYEVRDTEENLKDYSLYAPFSGHIEGDGVQLFSIVTPGEPLLTLTDTRELEVSVPLTREELMRLDPLKRDVVIRSTEGNDSCLTGKIQREDAPSWTGIHKP